MKSLKVAYVTKENKFTKELETERKKNANLQRELECLRQMCSKHTKTHLKEDLEGMKVSNQDLTTTFEAHMSSARMEVETLTQELEGE